MSIAAVLTDLDGTLAATAQANFAAYEQALAEAGVAIGSRDDFIVKAAGLHWSDFLPPLLAAAGSSALPEAIARRKTEIYGGRLHQVAINRPLLALITALHPILGIGLVTTASSASTEALLACHNLTGNFDVVVAGDHVRHRKPHPEAYLRAATLLGVRPDECLVFENSPAGMASARAAGADVVQIMFNQPFFALPPPHTLIGD